MDDKELAVMPVAVHEAAQARNERREKRLIALIALLILLLVGSNCCWIWYESQFETVESTTFEVEQEADNGTNNFAGGDLNGTSDG